jgi:hypothetical protein
MKYKMTSVKNQKSATVLVAIAALAGVFVVSWSAIGSARIALADDTKVSHSNNTGVNIQTDTNQKQECKTAAGTNSGITNSCAATSSDSITQSGGIHHK